MPIAKVFLKLLGHMKVVYNLAHVSRYIISVQLIGSLSHHVQMPKLKGENLIIHLASYRSFGKLSLLRELTILYVINSIMLSITKNEKKKILGGGLTVCPSNHTNSFNEFKFQ